MGQLNGSKCTELPQPLSTTTKTKQNKTSQYRFELARVPVRLLHASWLELSRLRNGWGPPIPEGCDPGSAKS